MKTFEFDGITVNVCRNIYEWAREFYEMPEDAEIANMEEVESECMGFASVYEQEIYVYIPENYEVIALLTVVAHELGHVARTDFEPNPDPDNDDAHEEKALHYENFVFDTLTVTQKILDLISKKPYKKII